MLKKYNFCVLFYLITIYCTSLDCIDQKRHTKKIPKQQTNQNDH